MVNVTAAMLEFGTTTPTPLDESMAKVLAVAASLGAISMFTCLILVLFIFYKLLTAKTLKKFVDKNQPLVLFFCVLIADGIQASSFVSGIHWIILRKIVPQTPACVVQGMLLHLGDVASSFFVMAISLQTFYMVCFGKALSYRVFVSAVIGIWFFAILLTFLAPMIFGWHIWAPAGVWCWISPEKEGARLALHYIWIFLVQFLLFIIYTAVVIYLAVVTRKEKDTSLINRIKTAQRIMLCYPLVYIALTLPLAAGRMRQYSGHTVSDQYYAVAGCMITCSGFVDAALYTFGRRMLRGTAPDDEEDNLTALTPPANPDVTEKKLPSESKSSLNDNITRRTSPADTLIGTPPRTPFNSPQSSQVRLPRSDSSTSQYRLENPPPAPNGRVAQSAAFQEHLVARRLSQPLSPAPFDIEVVPGPSPSPPKLAVGDRFPRLDSPIPSSYSAYRNKALPSPPPKAVLKVESYLPTTEPRTPTRPSRTIKHTWVSQSGSEHTLHACGCWRCSPEYYQEDLVESMKRRSDARRAEAGDIA